MAPKTHIKGELKRFFPSAFTSGPPKGKRTRFALEDTHQSLKNMTNMNFDPACGEVRLDMGIEVPRRMKISAEYTLAESSSIEGYIFAFDKYKFVKIAKGQEHSDRADGKEGANANLTTEEAVEEEPKIGKKQTKKRKPPPNYTPDDGIHFQDRRPYLVLDKPVPKDMPKAIDDRSNTQMEIIRNIVTAWIDNESGIQLNIPDDKFVIVDGHCLSVTICKRLGIDTAPLKKLINMEDEEKNDINKLMYATPIKVTCVGPSREVKVEWLTAFYNNIGEVDDTMFFYVKSLCESSPGGADMELYTIDTDALTSGLVFCATQARKLGTKVYPNQIYIRNDPSPNWVFYRDIPNLQVEQWVHINQLHLDIENANFCPKPEPLKAVADRCKKAKKPVPDDHTRCATASQLADFRRLKHKTFNVVVSLIAGGNDYIDGFYFVPHYHIFESLRIFADYVGDLVGFDKDNNDHEITIDGSAFSRLMLGAYITAHGMEIDGEPADPVDMDVKQVRASLARLDPRKQFPDTETLVAKTFHILKYMKEQMQLGNATIAEPNPLHYAYEPIDPKKPLSLTNIRRMNRISIACVPRC